MAGENEMVEYNQNNLEWLTATLGNNADPLTKELLIYYQNYHGQRSTWNPTGHEWLANHLDYVAGLLKQYVADYYPVEYAANQYGDKPFFAMLYFGLDEVSCMEYEMMSRGITSRDLLNLYYSHLSTNNCPQ